MAALADPDSRLEHAYLSQHELDRINQVIADYLDVLEEHTVTAWGSIEMKQMTTTVIITGKETPYAMDLREFAHDVRDWYENYVKYGFYRYRRHRI